MVFASGNTFTGSFANDKPHGKGRLEFLDGGHCDGHWLNGKMSGLGKWMNATGICFEGNFDNNLYHGMGKLELPNFEIYEGFFNQGNMQGHGTYHYQDGSIYIG